MLSRRIGSLVGFASLPSQHARLELIHPHIANKHSIELAQISSAIHVGERHSSSSAFGSINFQRSSLNKLAYYQPTRQAAVKRKTLRIKTTPLASKFKMEWPKITLFGDSITRRSTDPKNCCWGSMITYQVNNYFDVDTRGFEGYSTRWALELMPKLFPRAYLERVELFVEFFGHNDSWEGNLPMQVSPDQYEKNLHSMVEYLTSNGLDRSKIILVTPSWYHDGECKRWCKEAGMPPIGKSLEHAKKHSKIVLELCKLKGVDVVDSSISLKHIPDSFQQKKSQPGMRAHPDQLLRPCRLTANNLLQSTRTT